jgi:hypothetical protein
MDVAATSASPTNSPAHPFASPSEVDGENPNVAVAELVLSYIQALVWPSVVLYLILAFREQLAAILSRVVEASAFGATVKLDASARHAAVVSEALPELSHIPSDSEESAISWAARRAVPDRAADRYGQAVWASETTLGRILARWNRVERAASTLGEKLGLDSRRTFNVRHVVGVAVDRGVLSNDVRGLANELQSIRNELVHGKSPGLSASAADDLVSAMARLEFALIKATEEIGEAR